MSAGSMRRPSVYWRPLAVLARPAASSRSRIGVLRNPAQAAGLRMLDGKTEQDLPACDEWHQAPRVHAGVGRSLLGNHEASGG